MLAWLKQNALDVAAFIWGVAEATLFFFVPDVLLSYIGLKRGVRAATRASVSAAIGATLGRLARRQAASLGPHRCMALILRGIFHLNAELTQP